MRQLLLLLCVLRPSIERAAGRVEEDAKQVKQSEGLTAELEGKKERKHTREMSVTILI